MANRPLKIAIVNAADRGGGAQECVWALHRGLRELGHDSRLYVGYKYSDDPDVQEISRVPTIPGLLGAASWLERTMGWQHLYAPGFRQLVDVIPPDTDVVHLHSLWGSGGYADIAGVPRIARCFPTLLTLHEAWLFTGHCACYFNCRRWETGCGECPDLTRTMKINRDGTRFNWQRKRLALQRSRLLITTVSSWLRWEAEKSPFFDGKRIEVVHNGIDVSTFSPGPKHEARAGLGLPSDKIVVLMAGQTIEGINEGIAQHGVAALNRYQDSGLLALLVGKSASRVAETLSIPFKVLPFQNNPEAMAMCYRAADFTVVTSEFETFGRIAAESQACGTPVVAFATGGLPEVVNDGEGGVVVPTGDVEALEAAIRRLVDFPAEREEMGQRGAQWVRERFAKRVITEAYLDLYRQVAGQWGKS